MEKYLFMFLGVILGVAISLYIYGEKRERYAKRIKSDREYFSTKRLDEALDKAVKRMQLEMKALGRKLTEEEKNEIIFGFLRESNESNQ
ncbi:MAG: hypothetical protein IJH12_07260 [Clostridia bacterium]|jgi:galactokinase/mevalonate kinase-like predicted kinase|nr:hypothetical protein [Clostridia bacterium]